MSALWHNKAIGQGQGQTDPYIKQQRYGQCEACLLSRDLDMILNTTCVGFFFVLSKYYTKESKHWTKRRKL